MVGGGGGDENVDDMDGHVVSVFVVAVSD